MGLGRLKASGRVNIPDVWNISMVALSEMPIFAVSISIPVVIRDRVADGLMNPLLTGSWMRSTLGTS